MTFENAMSELEDIVKKLEKGDVTLEESLSLFENGVKLSKECQQMLDKAEKKVSVLMANQNGETVKQNFIPNEE